MAKITILGCGYGTALGVLYTTYGHDVTTWTKLNRRLNSFARSASTSGCSPE